MENTEILERTSAQRALLGAVTSNLRAVTVKIEQTIKLLKICFFYDGDISEEVFDLASIATAEMAADFPEYDLDDHIERLDYPKKILVEGILVYFRKESKKIEDWALKIKVDSTTDENRALILIQIALLGIVTPNLRAVKIGVDNENKILKVHFFYDGEISEQESFTLNSKINEILHSFLSGYQLDKKTVRLDFPNEIPVEGRLAYLRNE